ncbi:hypothetical protein CHS0354_021609 [Potamilus streckersoni]|uniref:Sodium channel protein n=1 Tax=Potamilus streckersoni TaxID=2493646 RepID=A0AAE0SPW5_9BIVA|nr:hypothetical protein CHS0354_021609 [Potamilus streckersoni]
MPIYAIPNTGFVSIASIEKEPLKDKVWRIVNSWECPWWWQNYVQKYAALFILDAFVDLFVTLCILVNTVFMAMDYHGISKEMMTTLERGNQVFSYIFAVEAFMKIIALGLFKYLKDGWNCFDIFIVLLSFLELLLDGVQGLSVLRSFRLLRVFKLAKSWPTLNMLISIVARTLGALGNLTFVLGIVVFIFAVMGQQLFGDDYAKYERDFGEELPRWNFTDFMHSFMIVFRVLCGEWIESMWGCMRVSNWPCVPFFLLTMVIGNLVVLNLFLALLLSSFGSENLSSGTDSGDEEPNKLAQAFDRFRRFGNWIKVNMIVCVKVKLSRSKKRPLPSSGVNGKEAFADGSVIVMDGDIPDGMHSEASTRPASRASLNEKKSLKSDSGSNFSSTSEGMENQSLKKVDAEGEPEINEVDVEFVTYPDDCFCEVCKRKCIWCAKVENTKIGMIWWKLRCLAYKLCEHKYFETFIISMIILSSIALALEDYYLPERPVLYDILRYCDKCFTFIFIGEMLIKWFAFGFMKYFTDAWCWLDFVIVGISIVMLAAESLGMSDVGAFKALRTLRALRPLRAVSRWEGMRVVVNALIKAIPAIFNVMLVCLVFWLIFGIVGVQLFSGKFYKCQNKDGIKLNRSEVANKTQCEEMERAGRNVTWTNAPINFDNVLNSYLALFQVATYKGWVDIMNDAIDIMGLDQQPEREVSIYFYLYFVLFIIFGSFFTLNLFIGVIIDNFNQQKKKAGGSLEMFMTEDQKKYYKAMKRMAAKSPIKAIPRPKAGGSLEMFMTDDQKKYYQAMKRMSSKSPQKSIPRPRFLPAAIIFDITTNQKFDIAIMVVIIMNMVTMTMEHYGQSAEFENVLHYVNLTFICIFTMECVLKLIGLRWYYFKIPWNVFDFGVVVLSILALALARTMETFPVSPTLLRVIRVFRIGRILRLVKSAKGIRTLLFSLAVSLPALFNIGLLLFLVLSIYATFGMGFFMHVELTGGLDDVFNFRTFGSSVVTLFQMCTSAGWDGVLKGLMNEKDCNKYGTAANGHKNTCGSYPTAVLFLVTYLVISFLVVVNMYIAVILENFSQATEDVQQGLTPDDFDMYYEKWEKYDPKATQYITLSELSDFVDYLEDPLRVPKPNHFMLVKLDIPICEGDRVNCRDILDALTKSFLGTSDLGDMPVDVKERKKGEVLYQQISSTLMRQKEHYAARIIQRAFRIYKGRNDDGDQGHAKPPPSYDEIAIDIPEAMEDSIERKDTEDTDNTKTDETKSLEESGNTEITRNEEEEKVEDTDDVNITPDQTTVEVDLRPDSDVVA